MTTEPTPANGTSESIKEAPPTSTAIIAEAAAVPPPPAPIETPRPAPSVPAAEPAWFVKIDYTLLTLVLILSFFVASFTATNGDLWLHLAIGKSISEGKFAFGVDPYSWATEATVDHSAVPWVHQSWLFSWLVYQIHSVDESGAVLVIFKAILFTLTIGLLSRIGWRGPNRWLVLICLALAVLAASGRLFLQPTVISLLFLVITLWVLDRAGAFALGQEPPGTLRLSRGLWGLPVLFALWANLDAWFILGPIVVGLCWAATGLGRWFPSTKMLPGKTLGLLFVVSVLACLANPFHVRVFQLPPELAYLVLGVTEPLRISLPDALVAAGRPLRDFRRLDSDADWTVTTLADWTMPIVAPRYWRLTRLGLNIAGLAIVPLVLLGLLGFTLTALVKPSKEAPSFHAGRFVLWLVFAVIGLLVYRLAPFFVLVAAPLTAMTLGEFLRWQQVHSTTPIERRDRGMKLARCLSVPFFLMLIGLAWPGWLHGSNEFSSPRRVAWRIRADGSMQAAAERVRELREAGACKNVFNASLELGNYLPWFAPEVKYGMDTRFALYPHEVPEWIKTRDALNQGPDADWQACFREHDIDQMVMVNFLTREGTARLTRWWDQSRIWRQRYVDRRVALFSWAGANRSWPSDQMSIDLDRAAFSVVPAKRRPRWEGTKSPTPQDVWESYLEGVPPMPATVGEVDMMQRLYASANRATHAEGTVWCRLLGLMALQGLPGGGIGLPPACDGITFIGITVPPYDFGPPALPILMVRAARQAVAENPLDANAQLVLVQADETLRRKQEDHWIHYQPQRGRHPSPLRERFRQIQQVTGVFNIVQLQPENFLAHEELAKLYLQQNMLDFALDHMILRQKALETLRASAPADKAKRIDVEIKKYQEDVDSVARNVKQRVSKWQEMSAKEKPFIKANMAHHGAFDMLLGNQPVKMPLGLAKAALEILENMDIDTLKGNEQLAYVALDYDLLLSLGRASIVAARLRDERIKKNLPPLAYARFQLLAAGALGDYKAMDEALATIEATLRPEVAKSREFMMELAKASGLHYFGTGAEFATIGPRYTFVPTLATYQGFKDKYLEYESLKGEFCNNITLHGIILLEAGETKKARAYFETALKEGEGAPLFADRPIARRYLELLSEQK